MGDHAGALEDFDLIDRAVQGKDQSAYATLMKRYKKAVYFMILKMILKQELEKLGANVTELRFLQDQLIQEKKSNTQRSAREIASLNQRIKDLSTLLVQKDKEINELQERYQALNTENEALKSNQSEMQKEVATINQQKQELATKVAEASKLKLTAIRISGINARGKELAAGKAFKNKQLKGVVFFIKKVPSQTFKS